MLAQMLGRLLERYICGLDAKLAKADRQFKIATPMEWGIDHLEDLSRTLGLKINSRFITKPEFAFHEFNRMAHTNPDAFFEIPNSVDYSFVDNRLTYQSPVRSLELENNLVTGRFFEANDKKDAIVLLSHWTGKSKNYDRFARWIKRLGISVLRISLPYHDERMPRSQKFPYQLLSSNIGLTLKSCRQAVLDTRIGVRWLKQRGYENVGVVGSSLGACIAHMAAAHDVLISSASFILVSSEFGGTIWEGSATRHIRDSLSPHLDQDRLESLWSILSPRTHVPHLREKKIPIILVTARYDDVFPKAYSDRFRHDLTRYNIPFEHREYLCGHHSLSTFPFNLKLILDVTSFIKNCHRKSDVPRVRHVQRSLDSKGLEPLTPAL